MAFLLGEETFPVGHNHAEVADTGLVNSGKVDLIENAMTQREPDPAVKVQRSAHAGLGARGPARFDPGPARRHSKLFPHRITAHRKSSSSPSRSLPEDQDLCLTSIGMRKRSIQSYAGLAVDESAFCSVVEGRFEP